MSIGDARNLDCIRLILTAGVPAPWGECIKAIMHLKKIKYTAVAQLIGKRDAELREWTGQDSAPVLVLPDNRVFSSWESILWQLETLAPDIKVIPNDIAKRIQMFGFLREFAGINGFAWNRRLQSLQAAGGPSSNEIVAVLCERYGYNDDAIERAEKTIRNMLLHCSNHLKKQAQSGSKFYVGNALSAVDIYSAIMCSIMINPLEHSKIPMPEGMRQGYSSHSHLWSGLDEAFWQHRDFIMANYVELPLQF